VVRTVWDGDREAWEIRMPNDTLNVVENDTTQLPDISHLDVGGTRLDPNPLFGRVLYTYGGGVDQPLGVHRYNYADHPDSTSTFLDDWPVFTIVPVWNFRGRPDNGSFHDGGQLLPHPTDTTRHVSIGWPAGFFAYWRRDDVDDYATAAFAAGIDNLSAFWHGSILRDKQDAVRTHYRRNRYYDPKSGQFTQEDPIGLAGGLNLYGFANGDPVNLSDPFGLQACDPPDDPRCEDERPASGRLESAGLFDIVALGTGGLFGAVKGFIGRLFGRTAASQAGGAFVVGQAGVAAQVGARTASGFALSRDAATRLAGRFGGRLGLDDLDAVINSPTARRFLDLDEGTVRIFDSSITRFGGEGLNVLINLAERRVVTAFPSSAAFMNNTARFRPKP